MDFEAQDAKELLDDNFGCSSLDHVFARLNLFLDRVRYRCVYVDPHSYSRVERGITTDGLALKPHAGAKLNAEEGQSDVVYPCVPEQLDLASSVLRWRLMVS